MMPSNVADVPEKVRSLQTGGWEIDAIENRSSTLRRIYASCRLPPGPPTGLRIDRG
jgi:hypothetical protein